MSNVKFNTSNYDVSNKSSSESSSNVSEEDSKSFEDSVKSDAPKNKDNKDLGKEQFLKKDNREQGSRADSILANLMGQNKLAENKLVQGANNISKAEINTDMINKLVDSIMVASSDNKQEVLIKVNNSVLADTQIALRMEEGKLFVMLQTSNAHSANTLHQNVGSLQASLNVNCKDKEVSVQIVEQTSQSDGHMDGQNDANSRSRGHFLWDDKG